MFVAGPPVVERLGPEAHQERAGRLGDPAQGRRASTTRSTPRRRRSRCARRFLSYLPSSVYDVPPRGPQHRRSGAARGVAVRRDPARHRASRTRCARSSRRWSTRARSSRCGRSTAARSSPGFARLDGWPVAVMASDPYFYGGGWTADACQKVERFVDIAETFHLPVVYLVRLPGLPDRARGREDAAPSGRACARCRRSARRPCRGARSSSATRSASPAPPTRTAAATARATPGRRAAGARCRSRAASRPPTAPTSTRADDPQAKMAEIEERLNKLRSPFRTRRDLLDRGDHRPARHAPAPLRVRQPGRAAARPGPVQPPDEALALDCVLDHRGNGAAAWPAAGHALCRAGVRQHRTLDRHGGRRHQRRGHHRHQYVGRRAGGRRRAGRRAGGWPLSRLMGRYGRRPGLASATASPSSAPGSARSASSRAASCCCSSA